MSKCIKMINYYHKLKISDDDWFLLRLINNTRWMNEEFFRTLHEFTNGYKNVILDVELF